MEKKRVFKRALSFLVAASLIQVPIVCAGNPSEDAAENERLWSVCIRSQVSTPLLSQCTDKLTETGFSNVAMHEVWRNLADSFVVLMDICRSHGGFLRCRSGFLAVRNLGR
ncbi:MAG: hypothetical protein LBJ83_01980 [Oscillospiraceae bacterium]|nr:hypothetical protein [Oscillospiraceae bacterium]